uniref:Reverse transcriptase domain-containing protein n=1 Tax=Cannabis sativa TaxID=3483 RepID=A0A803QFF3_CANSA
MKCDTGPTWHFSAFYGAPETQNRIHTWTLLERCKDVAPLMPWLVIGDFNEILSNQNKLGGALRSEAQMDKFRNVLDSCYLYEQPFEGDPYTWIKGRLNTNATKERLDWCFVNDQWQQSFKQITTHHLDYFKSDHRALSVTVLPLEDQLPNNPRRSRFRFEKLWLSDPAAAAIIQKEWKKNLPGTSVENFCSNITSCANSLQLWHTHKYGNMKKKIKEVHHEVEALNNQAVRSMDSMTHLKKMEDTLDELLSQEEVYWHQRSRINWLQSGDENTKFFHAYASSRKSNNTIKTLQNSAGITVHSKKELTEVICSFYEELFTATGTDAAALEQILHTVPRTVTDEMNQLLLRPFSDKDVLDALRSMSPDKSPGRVLNEGHDMSSLNKSVITLIPKIKSPKAMGDYRPISLCNVIYKLISKVLVMRFKDVLPSVISENQSAFLLNRLITDNILVAFELVHHLKHKKQGSKGYSALKLDMSKAFDRVEWDYLSAIMAKMGFANHWISLIMRCLSSNSFSFQLNGEIVGNVWPTRGLRQGDPLSPYLFLICSEGLSRLLSHEEEMGNLLGLKLTRNAPSVSHLLFADDSLLFCQANNNSALAIKEVLDVYHRASGQLLNTQKSIMSFSPNTSNGAQAFFSQTLEMPICECHESYLGLPAYSSHNKQELFSNVKEKIWKLLHAWNDKLFSVGGGMGFRSFIDFNQAMLAKQAWRLFENPNSLLGRLLKHRYFSRNSFLDAHLGHSPSLTWQGIHWGRKLLIKGLRFKVGNGFRIQSGLDPWIPGHDEFKPICYSGPSSMPVSTFILDTMEWNLDLLHNYFAQIDIDRIVTIPLSFYQSQDRMIWHYNTTGEYSVKSGFHLANSISEKNQESQSDDFKSCFLHKYRSAKASNCKNQGFNTLNSETVVPKNTHHGVSSLDSNHTPMNRRFGNDTHSAGVSRENLQNIAENSSQLAQNLQVQPPGSNRPQTNVISWSPPVGNSLKMNVDAAVNITDKKLGIGAVVRNNQGEVIAAFSKPSQGCFRSDEMEAKALFHSLIWATKHQLPLALVETDALRVSSALNSFHRDLSYFSNLIDDVRCLLSSFLGVTVAHVRRQANQAAHGLAKYALELDEDVTWIREIPYPIFSVIAVERLKANRENHKGNQQMLAMYSSIFGGITTDPAAMVIPIDDHMVHRGHGVFDTAVIVEGYLYGLDQHVNRIIRSAGMAKITPAFDKQTLRRILIQTASASKCRNGCLKYWLSVGGGDFELSPSGCNRPTFYAVVFQDDECPSFSFSKGIKVITSSIPIKPPQFATTKSVNYLPNVLSKMEAEEEGAFAGIWLDNEGFVAEGPNMNVAFVTKQNELLMPNFDKILSGCTANRILSLAEGLVSEGKLGGIRVGNVSVEEGKKNTTEMMLIGSFILVLPVIQWDDHIIGNGAEEGSIAQALFNLIIEDMKFGPPSVRVPIPY